jgi:uncharacterized 2Fe-2S/4Fe-4S cluster protein (DUF4445 family)
MVKINEKIIIDLEPISRRVYLFEDKSIYEILVKIGIPIRSLCGGSGKCGKCKILFQKGQEYLNSPTDSERNFINNDDIKKGWRLACQSRIDKVYIQTLEREKSSPQFRIYLPDELVLEDFKILTSGVNKDIKLNPNVKKLYIEVDKPTLEKPVPDIERILTSIISIDENIEKADLITIDFDLLKNLSQILRQSNHKITVVIWDNRIIIAAEPGNTVEENFGLAIDIGTTTLVGYLMNLNNGKTYSVASKLNGQTAFGEDLITRITYIKDNEDGLQKLNSVVINNLNDIISKACSKANINPSQIYETVVVGNSVMHHIFLGLNPVNIGLSPYVPIVRKGLNVKSKDLMINMSNQGKVYTLPLIAGFVGADTMGVILSSKIDDEDSLTLAIDIGTNGEIIIGNKEILATASCAAGSALEGAHIEDGMRAAAGSIDSIKIDPETLDVSYTTIKNKKPMGICGSGLIDAVAEMLKAKILNRSGNFNKKNLDHERIIKSDKGLGFILVKKDETNLSKDIKISQHDIRELQMAKAAFYSGMRIILRYLNKSLNKNLKIQQVFLAGAFGNYINKENAKFIGMIPDIPREDIFQIGNAAGMGAQNCLINKDLRKKAEELYEKIQYIEIATKKEFQKEYAEAMYFPHMKLLEFFPSLKEYEDISIR